MIGKNVLHYRIEEKLGAGGMGEVYRAHDTRLDRPVALKFLPESLRNDAEARERLIREAQSASKLHHPNIVSTFAIEEADGHDFIVMEYVTGRTLKDIIGSGDLSLKRVLVLARQIANALGAAHEQGITHRDIKSENILVNDKGEPKILDFGLAKLKGATRLTEMSSTLGTMSYMSPEQAQGQDVDHRSDLFSFAVVIYEMITGRLPFRGEHSAAITYAIVNEQPEPLARYKSGVSDDLQRFMDKALRKEVGTRYQSARDMVADLDVIAGDSAVSGIAPPQRRTHRGLWVALAGSVLALIVVSFLAFQNRGSGGPVAVAPAPGSDRIMLAVLPFENLGSPDDEYFADGITEEVTTQLAKLSGMGVISRTSAMSYKDTSKSLRQIGEELGVDYVLEGTIRWDKSSSRNRVRINPQLIKVADDTHLWADTYDREFNEIFSLQSDIAEKVATALDVTLLEPERVALAERPTENIEAYSTYLRGKERYNRIQGHDDRDAATAMFVRAVELDPEFSEAHAWLARIYANDHFNQREPEEDRLAMAKAEADLAMATSHGGPDGHLAMGYYHYYGSRDYDSALREFGQAIEGAPNNSALYEASGYVLRRQGRWEESVAALYTALELDPLSFNIASEYAQTLIRMRRYDEAERVMDQVLAVAPTYWPIMSLRAVARIFAPGENPIEEARVALDEAARYAPETDFLVDLYEVIDYVSRDYESALKRRTSLAEQEDPDSVDYYSTQALYHHLAGHVTEARAYADSAQGAIRTRLARNPEDHQMQMHMASTCAVMGDVERANAYGERALELMPMSRDAVVSADLSNQFFRVLVMSGQTDRALDQLEYILSVPDFSSRAFFKIDPMVDRLRDHPRFKRIMNESL